MMLKITAVIGLVFLPIFSLAQTVRLHIVGKTSLKPVEYATIKMLGKKGGGITDKYGNIDLSMSAGDSISVSCIGYQTGVFMIRSATDTIILNEAVISLPTVEIRELKFEEEAIEVGWSGSRDELNYPTVISNGVGEFAQKIRLPDSFKRYLLAGISLQARKSPADVNLLLRVYTIDSVDKKPREEIFRKVLLESKIRRGKITVDLRDEGIVFDNNDEFFVSVSWIRPSQRSTALFLSTHSEEPLLHRSIRAISYSWYNYEPFIGTNGKTFRVGGTFSAELIPLKEN